MREEGEERRRWMESKNCLLWLSLGTWETTPLHGWTGEREDSISLT